MGMNRSLAMGFIGLLLVACAQVPAKPTTEPSGSVAGSTLPIGSSAPTDPQVLCRMADLFIGGADQLKEANRRFESGDVKGAAQLARETWTMNVALLSTNWAQADIELLGVALSWATVGSSENDLAALIDPTIPVTRFQKDRAAALETMTNALAAALKAQRGIEASGALTCNPAHG
jgi:hypothetical protein